MIASYTRGEPSHELPYAIRPLNEAYVVAFGVIAQGTEHGGELRNSGSVSKVVAEIHSGKASA